ncbi:MAG: hypothetical protein QM739_07780 [Propionivibrio sp.]
MRARHFLQICGRVLIVSLLLLMLIHNLAHSAPGNRKSAAPVAENAAGSPGDIMLTQVRLDEAVRLLAQIGKANIVVTGKVSEQIVSLYLRNTTVNDMIRNLCRAAGVWYRYDTPSKTYIIMSGDEYQKDLAIVRDEQTQVFTLRHHNVVSTANAIKGLFGARVQLSAPVEEAPPQSLGSGTRMTTSTGSRSSNPGNGATTRSAGGFQSSAASGSSGEAPASSAGRAGSAAGAAYDPAADLGRLSLDRLNGQLSTDAGGQPVANLSDIQNMAARQAPSIFVTYNKLNNLLLVRTGDDAALKQIAKLVTEMDKPPKQVLLEMQILEVSLDNGFKSVFDIVYASGTPSSSSPVPIGGDATRKNSIGSGNFGTEDDATFTWQVLGSKLSARLQLMAEENKLRVLSSPMLVASNNQPAHLFIGDERVLVVGASSESTTGTTGATNTTITVETEKRDVGQTLSILPRINGDRSVSLTIDQDSSTVKVGDTTLPISTADGDIIYYPIDTVNTATLQVTAHAKDGMTVAVGGMIRNSTQFDEQKVPVLGDLPVLGTLFKRDVRASERTQIVLLITPRVLENPEEADAVAREKTRDYEAQTASFQDKPVVPGIADLKESLRAANVLPRDPAQASPSVNLKGAEATYAALARDAATAVRQSDPTLPAPHGLQALPVEDRRPLTLANGMRAQAAGTWMRDGFHVTALRVFNTSAQEDLLAPTLIPGQWSAMVLERTRLAAAGAGESWTWAYAVSKLPFEEAVERP